ncbi:MAG: protein kinase [Chloracidobacterium sp.]|nr:protein kinase [Chloracidobacterium sp.]MDW8217645.1 protein kinase [Acidobacteriota bacterium]
MTKTINPYLNRVAIRDPAQFYGRRREVARIFSRLGAGRPQSIAVVGDRRIGKSSLLNYLCAPSVRERYLSRPEEYVFVFFDLQQRRRITLDDFLDAWLVEIERSAALPPSGKCGFDGIHAALDTLRATHRKLIAVFDEFDILTSNRAFSADFFAFLRALANNYEVAYVTSSGRDLQELCHAEQIADSPFFNIFTNIYLRAFPDDEATELIVQPSEAAGIPLAPYADEIRRLSGNFPFYLQIACSIYFEQLQESGRLDLAAVEEAFDDEVRGHFRYLWEHFSADERAVCQALASGQPILREHTYVFEDFKRAGYVVLEADGSPRWFSRRFLPLVLRPVRSVGEHVTVPPTLEIPALLQPTSQDDTQSLQLNGAATPTRFGRFEVIERLGGGGMGDVFLARDGELGRKVAIKVLKARYAHQSETRRRFLREARMVSNLNHPNIATLYEIGEVEGVPYLVMEYIRGKTIAQCLREQGRFTCADVCRIGAQAAEGLAAAHAGGVVHRDIKPSNLQLDAEGNVHIIDFGLAKLDVGTEGTPMSASDDHLPAVSDITEPGVLVGTVTYMSPEQAANDAHASLAGDVFSLGIVLYEMTTGRLPFDGKSYYEVLDAILHATPAPIWDWRPDAPSGLVNAINAALAKRPADRPTAAALARMLRQTAL